ncbi:4dc4016e-b38f-4d7a-b9b7-d2dd93373c73 [Sclerotinia trifoliorum]|uniref:Thymocyte nuclear protein 1 n=1 Tax=Sclerotinia trifoliorum TaxID=28548 RepID=A0A8H2ZVE2_9HELO|nr:4dc4016e-b38f-4d7a-b9b7-d2dd93373c73 [Sclerotinia trifoliorum]
MVKRKAKEIGDEVPVHVEPRRSSRQKTNNNNNNNNNNNKSLKEETTSSASQASNRNKENKKKSTNGKSTKGAEVNGEVTAPKSNTNSIKSTQSSLLNGTKPTSTAVSSAESSSTRQYWLMKAEPESRIEKGHDIKFSIDDLAAKTEPEPWDGIRAYPARNNLRAMKKGDLAFFYHSSCKTPAIVGIMEIVQEHSPDLSAHDPTAPYYDSKSSPDDPKWSVVHVEFRQKLKTPITLKEIKAWFEEKGNALNNMQMLKLARLSVSKVSSDEWRFLVGEMEKNGDVVKE